MVEVSANTELDGSADRTALRPARALKVALFAGLFVSGCGPSNDCAKGTGNSGLQPMMYVHRGADALLNIANNPGSITVTPRPVATSDGACVSSPTDSGTNAAIQQVSNDLSNNQVPAKVNCSAATPVLEVTVGNGVDHYYAINIIGTSDASQKGSGIYFNATDNQSAQVMHEFPPGE